MVFFIVQWVAFSLNTIHRIWKNVERTFIISFRYFYICHSEKGLVENKSLSTGLHWLFLMFFYSLHSNVIYIKALFPERDPEKRFPDNMLEGLICLQDKSLVSGGKDLFHKKYYWVLILPLQICKFECMKRLLGTI